MAVNFTKLILFLIVGTIIIGTNSHMPGKSDPSNRFSNFDLSAISFEGGNGSIENPFLISNISQLQKINDNLSANYLVINDIDASETISWNEGDGFEPIGEYDDWPAIYRPFEGKIDGNGHIISDLYIYRQMNRFVGLFSFIEGKVLNIHLVNCHIQGSDSVAGIAAVSEGIIENCSVIGSFSGGGNVGGVVGGLFNNMLGKVVNSYYCIDQTEINGNMLAGKNGMYNPEFQDWIDNDLEITIDDYLTKIPGTDYYEVGTISDFKNILPFSELGGYNYKLTSDLDLFDEVGFCVPILNSTEFHGNGFSISNLYFNNTYQINTGLFYDVKGSNIHDLELINFNIEGFINVGGLAGYVEDSKISNCSINGMKNNIIGKRYGGGLIGYALFTSIQDCQSYTIPHMWESKTGGLVGYVDESKLSRCSSYGCLDGFETNSGIGGLVGLNRGDIDYCVYSGNLSGQFHTGGITGTNYGTINHSFSFGNITGWEDVGGICGTVSNGGIISNCYSYCDINGENEVGGLIGTHRGLVENSFSNGNVRGINYTGGLIGQTIHSQSYAEIRNCSSNSDVSGMNDVGGLIGKLLEGHVSNSYSTGSVEGEDDVGGFIGEVSLSNITNSYSIGEVTSGNLGGGFISTSDESEIEGCFWDTETSRWTLSDEGVGKTTDEMVLKSTFSVAGWDFGSIWSIIDNTTYPFLKWEDNQDLEIITEGIFYANEDEEFNLNYEFSDGNPTDIRPHFSMVTNGSWIQINKEEKSIHGIPENKDVGSYWINISGQDGRGSFDFSNFTLVVNNTNDGPLIITVPSKNLMEDEFYEEYIEARDDDPTSDTLTWSYESNSSFLAFDPDILRISGLPQNSNVGYYWNNISVSDGKGGMDWLNYTFQVVNINDEPIILTDVLTNATIQEYYSFKLEAVDMDLSNDLLTWAIITDLSFIELNASTGEIYGTPEIKDAGNHWILINVSDGCGGFAEMNLTFIIEWKNIAPIMIEGSREYVGNEDEVIDIDLDTIFQDPNGDQLSLNSIVSKNISIIINGDQIIITTKENWSGTEIHTITVTDGEFEIGENITITILPVEDAPSQLEIITQVVYYEGENQWLNGSAYDPDIEYGDQLSFKWYLDSGELIGEGGNVLLSLKEGGYQIKLVVTDTQGNSAEKVIEINVLKIINGDVDEKPNNDKSIPWVIFLLIIPIILIFILIFYLAKSKKRDIVEE